MTAVSAIVRKIPVLLTIFAITLIISACQEKVEPNRVDLEQIEVDRSNDYRYIFRDVIEEDTRKRNRFKKKEFQ